MIFSWFLKLLLKWGGSPSCMILRYGGMMMKWKRCGGRSAWLKKDRSEHLCKFHNTFYPAFKIFDEKSEVLKCSEKLRNNASSLLELLNLSEVQTLEKLEVKTHMGNRIVSLDETAARPIKKGESHPKCEFGTTLQMTFNREGFLITVENFIGKPNDTKFFPKTFELFMKRMRQHPVTVVGDLGFRSGADFKITEEIGNVSLERSEYIEDKFNGESYIIFLRNWEKIKSTILFEKLDADRPFFNTRLSNQIFFQFHHSFFSPFNTFMIDFFNHLNDGIFAFPSHCSAKPLNFIDTVSTLYRISPFQCFSSTSLTGLSHLRSGEIHISWKWLLYYKV